MFKIAKKEFKIGSTKQLGEVMYNEMKISSLKRTPTTAAGTIERMIFKLKISSAFHLNWSKPLKISATSFRKTTKVASAVAACTVTVKSKPSSDTALLPMIHFANSK